MGNLLTTRPEDLNSNVNTQQMLMRQFLMGKAFITLAVVTEVNETGDIVSVTPMVSGFTGSGDKIPNSPIFGVPVWRLQRGSSAVIMKPVIGDIGMIAMCDRDISAVKQSRSESLPTTNRTHSYSDAIYLGGVINQDPVQYVEFADDGIFVVSPLVVSIQADTVSVNGNSQIALNSPTIVLNGNVEQGNGIYGGNAIFGGNITAQGEVTGQGIHLSTHKHGGVMSGGSNTTGPVN